MRKVLTFELLEVSKECRPDYTAKRAEIVAKLVKKALTEPASTYGYLLRKFGQVRVILGSGGHSITTGCGDEGLPEDPRERSRCWIDAAKDMMKEMALISKYGKWATELEQIAAISDAVKHNEAIIQFVKHYGREIIGTDSGSMHRVLGRCFDIKQYAGCFEALLKLHDELVPQEAPAQVARIDAVTDPSETPPLTLDAAADQMLGVLEGADIGPAPAAKLFDTTR